MALGVGFPCQTVAGFQRKAGTLGMASIVGPPYHWQVRFPPMILGISFPWHCRVGFRVEEMVEEMVLRA
jgi:hypothetical protein